MSKVLSVFPGFTPACVGKEDVCCLRGCALLAVRPSSFLLGCLHQGHPHPPGSCLGMGSCSSGWADGGRFVFSFDPTLKERATKQINLLIKNLGWGSLFSLTLSILYTVCAHLMQT